MAVAKTSESDGIDGDYMFRANKRSRNEIDDGTTIGLRTGDSHRNFPWSDHNIQVPNFQNHYTIQDLLNMIKGGSYQSKFVDFVNIIPKTDGKNSIQGDLQLTCTQLFQKDLTPSDVGKLNRLVIPKKYAIKHFPYIENDQQRLINGGSEDIELVFYDKLMKTWKFRYWYCKSSRSFVFTRGWNRFVKDKKLREKDVIAFYTCECPHEMKNGLNFFLIDVNYNGDESGCINGGKKVIKRAETSSFYHREGDLQMGLELNLEKNFYCRLDNNSNNGNDEEHGLSQLKSSQNVKEKRITLFGAQIN